MQKTDHTGVTADTHLKTAIGKATRRLAWILVLVYCIAVIDRVNIGYAALTMNKSLGLSTAAFGLGATLFLVGYIIFEIPSNLALQRFGASRWLSRIAITWGLATVYMAFVTDQTGFLLTRFAIGAAEAGAFPGILWFITQWFPKSHRARLNAIFLLSIPLTNAISGPVAAALLGLNGVQGFQGWQWLFIVEGLVSVLVGFVGWFALTDGPGKAKWLSDDERAALTSALEKEVKEAGPATSVWKAMRNGTTILLGVMYSGINVSLTTAAFWLPQVIKSTGLSATSASLATAVPFASGAIAMLIWGRHSDRTDERLWHTFLPALTASIGWMLASFMDTPFYLLAALSLAAVGHFSATAVLWTIPPRYMSGAAAAAGMAVVSAIANTASAFAPLVIGGLKDATGGWQASLLAVGTYILVTPLSVLVLRRTSAGKSVSAPRPIVEAAK